MIGRLPSPEEFRRLDGLLGQALDLPVDQRAAFLAGAAADTQELQRLTRLLQAAQDAPDLADVAVATPDLDHAPPERIAGWQVLGTLGSGGMADVLLAERMLAGTRQRAAVKMLRSTWHDRPSRQRFARERQILAQLDDARIARLLDGGVLDDGRPWLALEHVQGQHIDRWCDQHRSDLASRVRLLVEVAGAVASAHRHLVVHRDIKPANVLVTEDGQVKLLDFGIAKVLDDQAEGDAPETRMAVLTPEFASPEQLAGLPVTTASDVYQLGLLLYVLVCGRRPFDDDSGRYLPTLIRNISERDAPSPLRAVGRDPARIQALATTRSTTPTRLRRALKGDIGAILAKALERDPDRRYASAPDLAADLQRWLRNFPVQARAPSPGYRLWRLIQRNPVASVLTLALLATLVAFTVSTQRQLRTITEELAFSQGIRSFLGSLFLSAEPIPGSEPPSDVMATLEQGIVDARDRFQGQPRLLAELQMVLGASLISRGEYQRATGHLAEAVQLIQDQPGNHRQSLVRAMQQLGNAQHFAGRYDEAAGTFRQILRLMPDDPPTLWQARSSLASLLHSVGRYGEAADQADAAWKLLDDGHPAQGFFRIDIARIRGDIARDHGDFAGAERWLRQTERELQTAFPDDRLGLAWTRGALAQTLALAGRDQEAIVLADQAMATYQALRGRFHAATAVTRYRRAIVTAAAGDPAAARADFLAAVDALAGDGHAPLIYTAYAGIELAWLDLAERRWQAAERRFDDAADALARINADGHARLAEIDLGRALLRQTAGDRPAASRALAEARRLRHRDFGADHAYTRIVDALDLHPAPALPAQAEAVEALYEVRRLRRALRALADGSDVHTGSADAATPATRQRQPGNPDQSTPPALDAITPTSTMSFLPLFAEEKGGSRPSAPAHAESTHENPSRSLPPVAAAVDGGAVVAGANPYARRWAAGDHDRGHRPIL